VVRPPAWQLLPNTKCKRLSRRPPRAIDGDGAPRSESETPPVSTQLQPFSTATAPPSVASGGQGSSSTTTTTTNATTSTSSGGAGIAGSAVGAGVALFIVSRLLSGGASLAALESDAVPLDAALRNGRPTVVEFYASWCAASAAAASTASATIPMQLQHTCWRGGGRCMCVRLFVCLTLLCPRPSLTGCAMNAHTLTAMPHRCEVCRELVPAEFEIEQQYKDQVWACVARTATLSRINTLMCMPSPSPPLFSEQSWPLHLNIQQPPLLYQGSTALLIALAISATGLCFMRRNMT
jgi:hypothetical protein